VLEGLQTNSSRESNHSGSGDPFSQRNPINEKYNCPHRRAKSHLTVHSNVFVGRGNFSVMITVSELRYARRRIERAQSTFVESPT
jgi:hypothetical protein